MSLPEQKTTVKRLPASEAERWRQYEREKRRLRERNLSPKEYERAIARLCERLGI